MKKQRRFSSSEIANFCGQVALLLNAGITPANGMEVMLSDTTDLRDREIIEKILKVCREGDKFYEALAAADVFPDYVIQMVSIGEESGRSDEVMQSLSEYYERENNLNENIKSAITYPMIMMGMMLLVIIVLIAKVLPIFQDVFRQLGAEMNAFSLSLLSIGQVISQCAYIIIALLLAAILFYLWISKTEAGRQNFLVFLSTFPLTRPFLDAIASGRFASGMALTLSSGFDAYHSLDLSDSLVNNPSMHEKVLLCKSLVADGSNLAEALAAAGIFTNLYAKMISVGNKAGSMDLVMKYIADKYEQETERKMGHLISILEPSLVIILSLVVGMILLSVIMPLMGIMSSIG